eukprot:6491708-Amphidinium_carterae.1
MIEVTPSCEQAVVAPIWQDALRSRYHLWSAARSEEKAGESQSAAKRLGYWVDGIAGKLGIGGERAGKLLGLTLHVLQQRRLTKRDIQIVSGLWAHAIQFRREVSTVFQKWWQQAAHWGAKSAPLSPSMTIELCTLVLHMPLLQIDLRSPLPASVLATDASSYGGGVCEGVELTPEGRLQVLYDVRGFFGHGRDRLCLVMVEDEMGRARRALELLGIETCLCICFARTSWGANVIHHAWPDTLMASSLAHIAVLWKEQQWSCAHLDVILLVGSSELLQQVLAYICETEIDCPRRTVKIPVGTVCFSEAPVREVCNVADVEQELGYLRDHTLSLCRSKDRKGSERMVDGWRSQILSHAISVHALCDQLWTALSSALDLPQRKSEAELLAEAGAVLNVQEGDCCADWMKLMMHSLFRR